MSFSMFSRGNSSAGSPMSFVSGTHNRIGSKRGLANQTKSNIDHEWLTRFNDYLDANLESELLSIPELAEEFAMSESTLLRQVKRLTGMPPISYIQAKRMAKAFEFLQRGYYDSVQEVANAVGYQHTGSFTRTFKQCYGVLPSEVN